MAGPIDVFLRPNLVSDDVARILPGYVEDEGSLLGKSAAARAGAGPFRRRPPSPVYFVHYVNLTRGISSNGFASPPHSC